MKLLGQIVERVRLKSHLTQLYLSFPPGPNGRVVIINGLDEGEQTNNPYKITIILLLMAQGHPVSHIADRRSEPMSLIHSAML